VAERRKRVSHVFTCWIAFLPKKRKTSQHERGKKGGGELLWGNGDFI